MDVVLMIMSFLLMIIGLLGCILPALPGPPISYVGFLVLHFTDDVQFSNTEIFILLFLVIIVQVLDYFIPILGSKYTGGTKWGNWGAFIGSVLGLFFMPWGLLLGPFIGAFIGEILGNSDFKVAIKSGSGALLGFLLGTVMKITLCIYFIYLFIDAAFFS